MEAVSGKKLLRTRKVPLRCSVNRSNAEKDTTTAFLCTASKDRFRRFMDASWAGSQHEVVDINSNGQASLTDLEEWAFIKLVKLLELMDSPTEGVVNDDGPKLLLDLPTLGALSRPSHYTHSFRSPSTYIVGSLLRFAFENDP